MFNDGGLSVADIAAVTRDNDNNGFGGNNGWWLLIILFALFGWGGNGYGWGANYGGAQGAQTSSVYEGYVLNNDFSQIARQISDSTAMTERKLDGINNGLCSGFYQEAQLINGIDKSISNGVYAIQDAIQANTVAGMQNTNAINAGITNLGTQLASCCCDIRYENASKFADLNYRLAEQSCQTRQAIADSTAAITANNDANTRAILDFMTQDKIASLTAENASLKAAANNAAQTYDIVSQLRQPTPIPSYTVPNPYCNCNCNTGCGQNYGTTIA